MQLGVVHALLVSRGRAPDVVIGSSAGAVNAIALAEVLQSGDVDDLGPKVARFRQLFEAYRKAPGEIAQALRPDPSVVDTQRPLEPLKLPVHHRLERRGRLDAVAAHAGLINLYNTLLNVRLTIGTITRGIRRWLGVKAAAEIRNPWVRPFVIVGEWFRSWTLFGANLHRAATLVPSILRAAMLGEPPREEGATAADLIFASPLWRAARRRAAFYASGLTLVALWLAVSALVAAVPALLGAGLLRLVVPLWRAVPLPWLAVLAFALGAGILCVAFIALTRAWSFRALFQAVGTVGAFVLLIAVWAGVLAAVLSIPLLVDAIYNSVAHPSRFHWSWSSPRYWTAAPVVIAVLGLLGVVLVAARRRGFWRRLLALYSLDDAILDPDVLRQLLTRLFDPGYYGDGDTRKAVERAMRDDNTPRDGPLAAKRVGEYAYATEPSPRVHVAKRRSGDSRDESKRPPPIHVAIAVADVASGLLTTLPGSYSVVDALVAALARPPLFPPVSCDGHLYVDATAVAYEPTQALFALLRDSGLVDERAAVVHVYSVAPFPFTRPSLGPEPSRDGGPREYTGLLDVVKRALQLRRFRDATVERRLTHLHTRGMPREGGVFFSARGRRFVRAWVYPIEPEEPLAVNQVVLEADAEGKRRRIIAETVADGCRAALQMMIQPAIDAVAQNVPNEGRVTPCRAAVEKHLADLGGVASDLPGSTRTAPDSGPGVAEVCGHCALFRRRGSAPPPGRPEPRSRSLIVHAQQAPRWPPHEGQDPDWVEPSHAASTHRPPSLQHVWAGRWPAPRPDAAEDQRSTVSLLFSGGVFRGVFQVGVLNAVSEASLRPDVVAGASVGSITSAMAARAFVTDAGLSGPNALRARQQFIHELAAAYLTIDRLILTDRFADFVRGLTVRAAQARFSIKDADRVIRRFDDADPWTYSRELRRVVAGIERLTYVSPVELRDLVEAFRRQRLGRGTRLLEQYFQELLDRAGVGLEVLGAEPLERLILDYVLRGLSRDPRQERPKLTFDAFLEHGLFFFATATNLTEGFLETLGEEQLGGVGSGLNVLQALLASSAFPGVFRPRWSWEVRPVTPRHEQYADGGVIDNLPLDAVADFLHQAATMGLIRHRPPVPHLILCASLETQPPNIGDERTLNDLRHDWPRLRRRATELAYNRKLALFAGTQRSIRDMIAERGAGFTAGEDWTPLDLEVVTVIPQWLCGTFAFHPMLGFQRSKQAASIAHGCASALLELGRQAAGDGGVAKTTAWGLDTSHLPNAAQSLAAEPFVPVEHPGKDGNCWYRPRVPCPFSIQGQKAAGASDHGRTAVELHEIYRQCRRSGTHRPQ